MTDRNSASGVTLVMPAFNEEEGIAEFITEIVDAFDDCPVSLIVVDDASTDGTAAVLRDLADRYPLKIARMDRNSGHGPATLAALALGLEQSSDTIVAVDGDGQFRGHDLRMVASLVQAGHVDIVEGARRSRSDAWFRIVVSLVTRALVLARTGRLPEDANTPCRGYTREALSRMLQLVPSGARVPNLIISAQARSCGFKVKQVDVDALPRRATRNVGTMWRARFTVLPSKRFMTFCILSAGEILGPLPGCGARDRDPSA